jgi:hypothetical protein
MRAQVSPCGLSNDASVIDALTDVTAISYATTDDDAASNVSTTVATSYATLVVLTATPAQLRIQLAPSNELNVRLKPDDVGCWCPDAGISLITSLDSGVPILRSCLAKKSMKSDVS